MEHIKSMISIKNPWEDNFFSKIYTLKNTKAENELNEFNWRL